LWFQKIAIVPPPPNQGRLMAIPRGRVFFKAPFLKESMALKWNFQRG